MPTVNNQPSRLQQQQKTLPVRLVVLAMWTFVLKTFINFKLDIVYFIILLTISFGEGLYVSALVYMYVGNTTCAGEDKECPITQTPSELPDREFILPGHIF